MNLFLSIYIFLSSSLLAMSTENNSAYCHELYAQVYKSRKRLVRSLIIKKPSILSSKKHKNIYNHCRDARMKHLRAFDSSLKDFEIFVYNNNALKEKQNTDKNHGLEELYASNCRRFAQGLLAFVDWSLGEGPVGLDNIYNQWLKKAQK
jgi:hypothetical protein